MPSKPPSLDRRSFLKLGAASTGLALSVAAVGEERPAAVEDRTVRYRPLGRTGLRVSEVSFGTFGFDDPTLLHTALDEGVNLICTSADYQEGRAERTIGKVLTKIGGRRDDLVLLSGTKIRHGDTKKAILTAIDGSLRRMGTDRLEIFKTHGVETPELLRRDELFEAFEAAKKAGKVKHLGLSGHRGGMQTCLNAAINDGRFEVFQIKYDFVSYLHAFDILMRADREGIGTIAFKTNAGYRQDEIRDLEADGFSFKQATVKWALRNPAVASVCVDIRDFGDVEDYSEASGGLSDAEEEMLRRYARHMDDKYCRFCGECETRCPHGVAVADINRYAMYFKYYGREKSSMELYADLPKTRGAAACGTCSGTCEDSCPFGRRIRPELVEAHEMLSFRKT